MHPPDELEEYLRGASALSRQYRREPSPSAPHALERRVFTIAADARGTLPKSRHKRPYLAPAALAASVLLSLAMMFALVIGPQSPKHHDKPHLVRASAHAEPQLRMYSSDPQPSRSAGVWLERIAALRRAGRDAEADAELRRFRNAYPSYRWDAGAVRP